MPTLWDAPLVAAAARALNARLRGARLRAVHLEYEARRLRLHFREHTLVVLLHPDEAGLLLLDPSEPTDEARPLAARLRAVRAPADDRLLVLELLRVRGRPAEADVVVELLPTQENALVTEGPDRTIRHLLRERGGARPLRAGHPWRAPPASQRAGAEGPVAVEVWRAALAAVEPARRRGALLSTFAWTSAVNAPALLGAAAHEGAGAEASGMALAAGHRLWVRLGEVARGEVPTDPVVLEGRRGAQPYPLPLPGLPGRAAADLLEAFRLAASEGGAPVLPALPASLLAALERRAGRARGRVASLEDEAARLPDPEALRSLGDLLLARFGEVPRGEERVTLRGFDGEPVTLELDPALPPDANARELYDRAARAERARERLPGLASEARAAWQALEALLERARAGDAGRSEVDAALPDEPDPSGSGASTLPYRRYRSSGGLEIRVGRGARRNDDLTFHHSAPDDVWMHARHAAGAHVIVRWDREGNPPARDLAEAAVLAALHSRARTSGSVPVDWTRRKYVRKPRGSAPGAVVPDRVQTLFVEPDPALEERLRSE
jgi:predicted ribosome quality control (RQC) complex YloA/Tae2 family protein